MKSLQDVVEKQCQELRDLLPVVTCLAGSKDDKEQVWIEVFRFMDQVMPADTADCSLYLLAEDAFNAITYADQVCSSLPLGHLLYSIPSPSLSLPASADLCMWGLAVIEKCTTVVWALS